MDLSNRNADADSLDEWISEIAETRNLSEEEVLNQIMSSYWILAELSGMVQDTQFERADDNGRSPPSGGSEPGAPSTESEGAEEPGDVTIDRELLAFLTNVAGQNAGNRGSASADDAPRTVLDALSDLETPSNASSAASRGDEARTDDLIARIDRLESLLETRRDRTSRRDHLDRETTERSRSDQPTTGRRIDDLSERVDAVESELTALETSEDRLKNAIEEAEDRIDERASKETVRDVASRLEPLEERVRARIEELESDLSGEIGAVETRMRDDLDTVEEILKYLVDSSDDHDENVRALFEAYEALDSTVEKIAAQQALAEIKNEANRNDVQKATCESCENEVRIALLSDCTCPHCGRYFDGLTARSRLWTTKATFRTTDHEPTAGPLRTETDEVFAGTSDDENAPRPSPNETNGERSNYGFEWFSSE